MSQALAALVVTRDRLDHLKTTLARLLDSPADVLVEVVVVDNASTDGTGAWLAAQRDVRLTVLTQAENLGGINASSEPMHGRNYSLNITVPPLAALIFQRDLD